jgi:hypothetical protein
LGRQAATPFLVKISGGNNKRLYNIALTEEQINQL